MKLEEAKRIEGRCIDCGEYTNLIESCCGAPVIANGHVYSLSEVDEEEQWEHA